MYLKRHYDPDTLGEGKTPKVSHVEVIHTGSKAEQNFDDGLIEQAVVDGWASVSGDRLTLKTADGELAYSITRMPGYFCKSTGETIPLTDRAWLKFRLANDSSLSRPEALAWLQANGKAADDYDICVTFQCVLDAEQHEKYRAVTGPKGQTVAAHTLEA